MRRQAGSATSFFACLGDGLNLVFVDEEIRLAVASQTQHAVVEVFNPAPNGLTISNLMTTLI